MIYDYAHFFCDVLMQMCMWICFSDLPQHSLIIDVKTRWNTLYLMIERFLEQFPAIQAAVMDPRIKRQFEKEK